MFRKLISIEIKKNIKRKLLWVELAFLTFLIILIFVFLFASMQAPLEGVTISPEDQAKIPLLVTWPGSLAFAINFVGQSNIGVLLLNLFVGSATAQEYSWRTLNLWLSRGVARDHLLAAKLAAFILPSIMIVLTALLSAAGISTLISLQIDGHIKLDQLDIWALSVDMLLTIYTMLPYAAFTFLLAIATRSAVIAIGGSLIYIMVLEALLIQALPLAGNSLSKVAHYLPAKLTESVLNLNQFGQGLADGTLPDLLQPVQAIACIGLWTLLFFSISLWIFRRQDFIG